MRKILWLATLSVLAASITTAGAHAPTREAYIAKLDPMCQKTDRKLAPIGRDFVAALEQDQFNRAADLLADLNHIYSRSLKRLAKVDPPAEDIEQITDWLDLEMQDVRIGHRMIAALDAGKPARYNRYVEQSRALEDRINDTIGGYGFKHCNEV